MESVKPQFTPPDFDDKKLFTRAPGSTTDFVLTTEAGDMKRSALPSACISASTFTHLGERDAGAHDLVSWQLAVQIWGVTCA